MTFHAKYIPILEDNNDDQVLPESLVPEEPWRDNSSKGCKLNHKLLRLVLVALLAAFVSGTTGFYLGKYLERHQVEPDWLCKFRYALIIAEQTLMAMLQHHREESTPNLTTKHSLGPLLEKTPRGTGNQFFLVGDLY